MTFGLLDNFGPWQRHFVHSRILQQFRHVGAEPPRLRLVGSTAGLPPHHVLIERSSGGFVVTLQKDGQRKRWLGRVHQKLATALYWLSNSSAAVQSITINISDGDVFCDADFAFSVRTDWQAPVPDPYFFRARGFEAERQAGLAAPAWDDRSNKLNWRGGLNGRGWASFNPNDRLDGRVIQRLRMVYMSQPLEDADIAFSRFPLEHQNFVPYARKMGLLRPPIAEASWLNSRFAIDIDGYTNTWSNLLVRMLYGCCVFKIGSHFGYRQWYYPQLRPYEHYIPVSPDLQDLAQQVDWARSNPKDAAAIARCGQELARELTFTSQTLRAAEIIETGPGPRPF